ncbi:hypothetical protein [Humidesulfovibrio mexicanus]|jgi:hypothetical protein|nr:hypothetical protein [Humidesulfovibrio mexicanus]
MALEIRLREERGWVRVTLSGKLSAEAGKGQYQRIAGLTQAKGINRVLLDTRAVTGRESIPEIFDFMLRTYPAEPGGRRTACLDLPEHHVSARFFEHLMQNNGRDFRLFFDEQEALAWLNSGQP